MNKLEAVARALCVADHCNPDQQYGGEDAWIDWTYMAEAAIKAIDSYIPERTVAFVSKGVTYWSDGTASQADPFQKPILAKPTTTK